MASEARPLMALLRAGCKDVDGRDKRGHDTWNACVNLLVVWYQSDIMASEPGVNSALLSGRSGQATPLVSRAKAGRQSGYRQIRPLRTPQLVMLFQRPLPRRSEIHKINGLRGNIWQ
jgi:hypothetical protein